MTEIEWLSCPDPKVMLEFLRGKTHERKLRLFAVVCRREYMRFRPDIPADSLTSKYAEITELYVDGEVTIKEWDEVRECIHGTFHHPDAYNHATDEIHTATCCCYTDESTRDAETRIELAFLASIIHDIFANPFRPVTVDPRWLTETAVALANGIYEERAFDRMPILADALEDAGCDHADILSHCRGDGPHVRGCWVLDLLLGKS
jgi:hypothetical protein